jgi:hypothetical protein
MIVKVKDLYGQFIHIKVSPTTTVGEIKEMLRAKRKCPAGRLRLIYAGKEFSDDDPISVYKPFDTDSYIHLILPLSGC